MGLIMKKDDSEDNEYIDGIEVIGRGEARRRSGGRYRDGGPRGPDRGGHLGQDRCARCGSRDRGRPRAVRRRAQACRRSDEAAGADRDARSDADADKGPVRDHSADSPIAPSRPAASGNRHKMYIAIAVIAVIVAAVLGYVLGSGGLGRRASTPP